MRMWDPTKIAVVVVVGAGPSSSRALGKQVVTTAVAAVEERPTGALSVLCNLSRPSN